MGTEYQVLSPWADADPIPLRGISPRLADLDGKKVGLFTLTYKHASARVNSMIERKLKERFPTIQISRFDRNRGADLDSASDQVGGMIDPAQDRLDLTRFEEWVKNVDAVVGAVGD
jgi:hypothetical protein